MAARYYAPAPTRIGGRFYQRGQEVSVNGWSYTAIRRAIDQGQIAALDTSVSLITGGSGGGSHYVHTQTWPSATWEIKHGLGYDPGGIEVTDSDGYQADGWHLDITVPGSILKLTFAIPVAGTARLS